MVVEIVAVENDEANTDSLRPHLLLDEDVPDLESLLLFDEDEDEE
jgi:hypothetical protein